MAEKQPVDVTGLTNALKSKQVNISEEIADCMADLKEMRKGFRAGNEPSKADQGAIYACMKTLQACSMLIKSRPELAGKSAGKVSSTELISGRDDNARDTRHQPSRLPPPEDFE